MRKAIEIRLALDAPFPLDLLVRSPAQIEERLRLNDFFIQEILQRGQVLMRTETAEWVAKAEGDFGTAQLELGASKPNVDATEPSFLFSLDRRSVFIRVNLWPHHHNAVLRCASLN